MSGIVSRLVTLLCSLLVIAHAVTILIGDVGVGKTTIVNHVADSQFETSDGIASCNAGGAMYNLANVGRHVIYDFEGFNGFQSRSKHDIITSLFDIMKEHGIIQNVVVSDRDLLIKPFLIV